MALSRIVPKVLDNMIQKYSRLLPKFFEMIDMSFLDEESKQSYKAGLSSRLQKMQSHGE